MSGTDGNCRLSLHKTNLSITVCKKELRGDDDDNELLDRNAFSHNNKLSEMP